MSTSTSSAIPNNLNTYSRIALTLDGDIEADAGHLAGVVSRFESTCREPGFQVNASYMPPVMSRFARDAEPTDRWVAAVASGFLAADSGGLRAPGLHNLPWFRRPWPGRPRMPWTQLPWVRLPFIPRRNPVPGPGFQTSWLPIRPLPVSILPWWPPLPNPDVPTLAVTQWQWRRPPWLFVKTWIWLLLPIKIWKWLPWFPPIAPIFRPMPIVRPMPWPPRSWLPVMGFGASLFIRNRLSSIPRPWQPNIGLVDRIAPVKFIRPIVRRVMPKEDILGYVNPVAPNPDGHVTLPTSQAQLYKMVEEMPEHIRIIQIGPAEYVVLLKGSDNLASKESYDLVGPDGYDTLFLDATGESHYTNEVLEAILLANLGGDRQTKLHFVGHSQGGYVAQMLGTDPRVTSRFQIGTVTSYGMTNRLLNPPDNFRAYVYDSDIIRTLYPTDAHTTVLRSDHATPSIDDHTGYEYSAKLAKLAPPFSAYEGNTGELPYWDFTHNSGLWTKVRDAKAAVNSAAAEVERAAESAIASVESAAVATADAANRAMTATMDAASEFGDAVDSAVATTQETVDSAVKRSLDATTSLFDAENDI